MAEHPYREIPSCDHGVKFDLDQIRQPYPPGLEHVEILRKPEPTAYEIREMFPRLDGPCPLGCGYNGIAYASMEHYVYGDWQAVREWGGNIWDRFRKSWIVIPTNIGWKKPDKTGKPGPNVMGTGVALEAAQRVPTLPDVYGRYCAMKGSGAEVTIDLTSALVLFPTKPLSQNPALSWKSKATLELVEKSAQELAAATWIRRTTIEQNSLPEEDQPQLEDDDVYLPYVGCGNGGLRMSEVLPLLHKILVDDRFVLVHYQPF